MASNWVGQNIAAGLTNKGSQHKIQRGKRTIRPKSMREFYGPKWGVQERISNMSSGCGHRGAFFISETRASSETSLGIKMESPKSEGVVRQLR